MSATRFIPVFFAALVVIKHCHCICTAAQGAGLETARAERVLAGNENVERTSSPRCENESSCICRGAILTAVVPHVALDLTTWTAAAFDDLVATVCTKELADRPFDRLVDRPGGSRLISGRTLRAHLASYVI
jgi:hypothetical protein